MTTRNVILAKDPKFYHTKYGETERIHTTRISSIEITLQSQHKMIRGEMRKVTKKVTYTKDRIFIADLYMVGNEVFTEEIICVANGQLQSVAIQNLTLISQGMINVDMWIVYSDRKRKCISIRKRWDGEDISVTMEYNTTNKSTL